ncbi:unknown [Alistipes sp. CAG:514]|nr:unknown [Alistipes sp. CAG:514]
MEKLWVMPFWNLSRKPGSPNSDALKLILFCRDVL